MLAVPPGDRVAAQLQRLADRCCHGNNYCKQVLGLYQLSRVTPPPQSQGPGATPPAPCPRR